LVSLQISSLLKGFLGQESIFKSSGYIVSSFLLT